MNTTSPEILTPRSRTSADNVATIKESLGEIAQLEKERVRGVYAHGKERLQDVERRAEDYVRTRPLRSVAIAAGAGVLLGFLLGRRR